MEISDEITLKKLGVFLMFMKVNNLARVSESLDLSTVSVHRALHSLEEGLGCSLFKREGRNLIPLETAHVFAEYARQTISACEEGVRRVRHMAGFNASKLHIGSLYSLTLHCIPQIIVGLKLRKPTLDAVLTMGSNQELLRGLTEGHLDAIIIAAIESVSNSDLLSVSLFNDTVYLAAPVGSPYKDSHEIDLAELRSEKFVVLSKGFATSQSFMDSFRKGGINPEIAMEVSDIFTLINFVGEGIGYGLLPGRIAAFSSRIQLIPLALKYASKQEVCLIFHKNRERDPNLVALAAECRMYAHKYLKKQTIKTSADTT